MTSFFHEYDLRGKYPGEVSLEKAERLGKAYGTYIKNGEVLVARDGRNHSQKVKEAFITGIRSVGVDVIDAGMIPTPVAYHGIREQGLKHGAIVTASHNPPEYTGFKFAKEEGLAMSREGGMEEIEKIYDQRSFQNSEKDGNLTRTNLKKEYINAVSKKFDVDLDIVVNYGNGVASTVAEELLEKIGCNVTNVNKQVDGSFPNHLPAPHHEKAQQSVRENMNDQELGIIFDGDADRAGFIYNGEYIPEDKVLALFSEEILTQNKEQKRILYDLRASRLVKETIKNNGGEPIETRVGHTFISEKIHQDEAVGFAGELSGHYYFPALNFPWDDGLLAACLMCQIVQERRISKLEDYNSYPVSPELRIQCSHDKKNSVIEGVADKFSDKKITRKDGVKIIFENGWALVRPSNTEEKMSIRCEADTQKDLQKIRDEVERSVKSLC